MKNKTVLFLSMFSIFLGTINVHSQVGLIKKTGTSINQTRKDHQESKLNNNKMSERNNENLQTGNFETGKGYFFTTFKPNNYLSSVGVGDDLFVRMELGKTMIEWCQEKGLSVDYTAYGFVVISIDGEKVFTSRPLSFASNISKQWTFINIPLSISPDFIAKIENDQSMLETAQDIWVFQQLFQENSIPKMYTEVAMKKLTNGSHQLKVELGFGESDSKEPLFIACSGDVAVVADASSVEMLAEKGPKHLRPLKESEKGNFVFNTVSFIAGFSDLKASLEVPEALKYYNMKWCQSSSCDYDHGNIEFYASIDEKPLAAWSQTFEGVDYEQMKKFDLVVFPKSDAGIGTVEATFNQSKLFKAENPMAYALFDLIYSGKLPVGKHLLKIKAYSPQSIPLNTAYEFDAAYFNQFPALAENSIVFEVTAEGKAQLIAASTAQKLTHASGEWVAIDQALKNSATGNSMDQIVDAATTSQWKVVTNSLGAILYRECKANVIYKSQYGFRMQKGVAVRQDYSGGGTYGTPYFSDRIEFMHGPSLLNSTHIPVPSEKVN